jgi:hypothetical protein
MLKPDNVPYLFYYAELERDQAVHRIDDEIMGGSRQGLERLIESHGSKRSVHRW